jgi:hypothetical protein
LSVTFESDSCLSLIRDGAFAECESLTSIWIPKSVRSLLSKVFYGCSHLSQVVFEPGSALSGIGQSAFLACHALESICIPHLVEVLEVGCFRHCHGLSRVDFEPDSHLRDILFGAFQNCLSLVSIQIPKSVESLGGLCFSSCPKLELIRVESGSRLRTVAESIVQWSNKRVIYVPSSVAQVFLRVFPFHRESATGEGALGQCPFPVCDHRLFKIVVSSLVVFEDCGCGVLPSRITALAFDEFEMGYRQALEDTLMNRVKTYSIVGISRPTQPVTPAA